MKSRAISGLIFGLCFAIIFTAISFFVPEITRATCGGKTGIKVYSFNLLGDTNCDGGSSTTGIGFPFPTKEKYSAPTINYGGFGMENPSYDWKVVPIGIVLNLIVYWAVGFVFFFIFSRNRHKPKPNKT